VFRATKKGDKEEVEGEKRGRCGGGTFSKGGGDNAPRKRRHGALLMGSLGAGECGGKRGGVNRLWLKQKKTGLDRMPPQGPRRGELEKKKENGGKGGG